MKALLLGMIVSAGIGPALIAQVDQTQWAYEFCWSMVGGTGGVLIFVMRYEESLCIRKLAKVALTNLIAASVLGPAASWLISRSMGFPVYPPALTSVSCILGFTANHLIDTGLPIWQKAWEAWNQRKANELTGEHDKQP